MRDQKLVNALREHAEWAEGNQWETPITLCDELAEAADLIEAQSKEIDALRNELCLKGGKKMEVLEFLKESKRMCRSFVGSCVGCPLEKVGCLINAYVSDDDYKRIVATVEQWSKEHPRKTRQSVFLKRWPGAEIDECGYLMLCPKRIFADYRNGCENYTNRACSDCRREFWMQEVKG